MTKIKEAILLAVGRSLNVSGWLHLRNRFYLWVCRRRHESSSEDEWCLFDNLKAVMDKRK